MDKTVFNFEEERIAAIVERTLRPSGAMHTQILQETFSHAVMYEFFPVPELIPI